MGTSTRPTVCRTVEPWKSRCSRYRIVLPRPTLAVLSRVSIVTTGPPGHDGRAGEGGYDDKRDATPQGAAGRPGRGDAGRGPGPGAGVGARGGRNVDPDRGRGDPT